MRTSLFLLSFLFSGALLAAEGELTVTSKITAAKVYLNGAQVTRTASRSLPVGSSTLVFAGLSQQVDAQSIQVNGKGGFAILGVTLRMNYLTESPKKKEIEELQAQVKKLEKEWAYEKAMQDVWVNEEQLLQKNSVIGGQQNGLTASQLTAVNDYVRERLRTTKANWLTQQEKLTAIGEEADKLRQQLAQLQAQAPRPTSEVVVEIDAPSAVSASFVLSYFVRQAGWTPAYDLRAKSVGQPIELLMKARIMNNTGEDWEKVEIALSSGNPTLGGVMPSMAPWVLDQPIYIQSISLDKKSKGMYDERPAAAPSKSARKRARHGGHGGKGCHHRALEHRGVPHHQRGVRDRRALQRSFRWTVPHGRRDHALHPGAVQALQHAETGSRCLPLCTHHGMGGPQPTAR